MSERRASYLDGVPARKGDTPTGRWEHLRYADGSPTPVRVLRGTGVIEVQSRGRRQLFDIAEYRAIGLDGSQAIDQSAKVPYNGDYEGD